MIAQRSGWGRGTLVLDGPGVGQDQGIEPGPPGKHQRGSGIAVAQSDDPAQLRAGLAEGGKCCGKVWRAGTEAQVLAFAVAHAAPVETEHRKAGGCNACCQLCLATPGPGTQFVAAADDQQSCRAPCLVQRTDQACAIAGEQDRLPVHVASPLARMAARASAWVASKSGSARSHSPLPPRSAWAMAVSVERTGMARSLKASRKGKDRK